MSLRSLAPLLLLVGLLSSTGTAGAQNGTIDDANATPPDEVNESVEDFSGPGGEVWSWFAIAIGVTMGVLLVVILLKRPRDGAPP
jgi:hypothetical protein